MNELIIRCTRLEGCGTLGKNLASPNIPNMEDNLDNLEYYLETTTDEEGNEDQDEYKDEVEEQVARCVYTN